MERTHSSWSTGITIVAREYLDIGSVVCLLFQMRLLIDAVGVCSAVLEHLEMSIVSQ